MSSLATGDIEAKGITPRADFKAAATAAPTPAKPYVTFAVKPEIANELIEKLDQIKGRTDDSKITTESVGNGGTKFSLIDTRNNQPLAVMNKQGNDATLTLYKSPEALAARIDSAFISVKDIKDFVEESKLSAPQVASTMKPGS